MRAVILAGGLGTRLRLYTTVSPKPLVPIGERPVLEHIIRSLARCGTNRINLCVNYLGDLILVYLAQIDLPPELRLAFHCSKRVDIDLGVIESEDSLVTDSCRRWKAGRSSYIEKPSLRYQVSMGIYVYEERPLKYLPEDGPCQFPDLVLRLIKAGERVAAYECDADWFDIGTVHEHERAVVDIKQFPEKYDVEAPLLDPHDVSRTFE